MKEKFGFGQPMDSIVQYAYIVPDIRKAMQEWTDLLGVGPWYFMEDFAAGPESDSVYRGQPTDLLMNGALAFSGSAQIELIQQKNDVPSVYKEVLESRGYGFHHNGRVVKDFDAELAKLVAQGFEAVFTTKAPPNGNRIAYLTGDSGLPGMIELIEADEATDLVFTKIYEASVDWDGKNPVRPMSDLF